MGSFFSSESLVQHQIWFQTLHNGPNNQCFQGMYHWPILGPLGPLWGPPKGHYESKKISFWNPERFKKCMYRVQNAFYPWWPPRWSILDRIGSVWAIQWPFQGRKGHNWDYLGPKIACFAHVNGPLGAFREGPKVQKWVRDIFFVNIGHLVPYKTFRREKRALYESNRSLLTSPSRPSLIHLVIL